MKHLLFSVLLLSIIGCASTDKEPRQEEAKVKKRDACKVSKDFPFIIRDVKEKSVANFAWLNHKPAGKFGWLMVKDGEFVFPHGQATRFFGINVVANRLFNMSHREADTVAAKFASLGVNMVRLHHMTARWQVAEPFYQNQDKSTLLFNDKAMEKLDYFIAALKREGIYITNEMIDSSLLKPVKGELRPEFFQQSNCFKTLLFFNNEARDYAKTWIKTFYCRKNRYTGTTLIHDPQFALMGLLNEYCFSLSKDKKILVQKLSPCYREEVKQLFREYLKENKLKAQPLDLTLADKVSAQFWSQLITRGYQYWYSYIRSLGYKGLINGSNFGENSYHHLPSVNADFMDSHLYWGYAKWLEDQAVRTVNGKWSILVKEPRNEGYYTKDLFARFSLAAIPGKPLVCSEHRTAVGGGTRSLSDPLKYSEYRALDLPFFSTIMAFQQWDGYFLFASQGWERLGKNEKMRHILDIRHDTTYMATVPVGAFLLRSDAIAKARKEVAVKLTRKDIFDMHMVPSFLNDAQFYYPERHKFVCLYPGIPYNRADYSKILTYQEAQNLSLDKQPAVIKADTGQFYRNWKAGWFVVNAPKAQGVEGFFCQDRLFDMDDIHIRMDSDFGVCYVIPHDDKPISQSKRMLFCVAGECYNTPNGDRKLDNWFLPGDAPVLLKPVAGQLQFKNGTYSIWSLGEQGERVKLVAKDATQFTFDTGRDKNVWYEIVRN